MPVRFYKGFNIETVMQQKVALGDAFKRGFDPRKAEIIDNNKDGFIDGDEFINFGINDPTISSLFRELSGDDYNPSFGNEQFENDEQVNKIKKASPNEAEKLMPSKADKSGNQNQVSLNHFGNNNNNNLNIIKDDIHKYDYFC